MADRQSKDQKTMTSSTGILPQDLVIEILSWLPVQSLLKFRFVSKSWFRLVSLNPSFSKNPSILALLPHSSIRFASDYTACDRAISSKSPFDQDITQVWGICNGLFCVSINGQNEEVFIWNPLCRDYITLPKSPPASRFSNDDNYDAFYDWGFCYLPASKEYKVIRVFLEADFAEMDYHSQVSLCTLGKDSIWSWRAIEKDFLFMVDCTAACPFVNGAFHWLASRPKKLSYDFIVAFDIEDEAFREIEPPHDAICKTLIMGNEVTNLNGKLCLYSLYPGENSQIWIMTQYGMNDTWTKLFNIKVTQIFGSFRYLVPLGATYTGEIILEKDHKLVLYNRESNRESNSVNELGEVGVYSTTYVYSASILSPRLLHGSQC